MKGNVRKNSGITLIALVITVIVLLILAGVTIASLIGDNGLLTRASSAKEEVDKAGVKEQISTEVLACIDTNGNIDKSMLATNLKNITGLTYEDGSAIGDEVELPTTVKLDGNLYRIYSEGKKVEAEETHTYSDETKAKLTEGKYVTYQGKPYVVLYDANSDFGWIEIVSENMVDTVSIGYEDSELPSDNELISNGYNTDNFDKARWSYNNAITTLHKKAQQYMSEISDRARCIGSNPRYPSDDTSKLKYAVTDSSVNAYIKTLGYNNKFKEFVYNYSTDVGKMNSLGIKTISDTSISTYYWLPSRAISERESDSTFSILIVNCTSGNVMRYFECKILPNGNTDVSNISVGFRPVIRLKSGVKVSNPSATGTADEPYELEI